MDIDFIQSKLRKIIREISIIESQIINLKKINTHNEIKGVQNEIYELIIDMLIAFERACIRIDTAAIEALTEINEIVHYGMGSDLMAICSKVIGISGKDQIKLSYVKDQVTCIDCLRLLIQGNKQ